MLARMLVLLCTGDLRSSSAVQFEIDSNCPILPCLQAPLNAVLVSQRQQGNPVLKQSCATY
jgi:hypothetical protein